ncbi:MAG: hypothetical protein COA61_006065 [Zetaproteobacteria bacterium]|nr:hypothetical protein [Zetaproteobacteria bacterium]
MNRRILPMMLVLLSVFVVAKVSSHWVQWEQNISKLSLSEAQALSKKQQPVASLQDEPLTSVERQRDDSKSMGWGELWIPSAEAAASMPIAEESATSNQDMKALQQARAQIAIKEKQLNEHLDALNKADERVKKRIKELENLESSIQDLLEQEKAIKNKKIKRLTAVYAAMKPDKAAAVISQMELITVVKMFSKMDEKKVGKILSFLRPKQAMMISQALTQGIATLK